MPNLEKGTVIADHKCGCCKKPVQVKINKNGGAYYFCPWTDDYGVPCSHHERWGKANSQKMQRNYLEARKASKTQSDEVTTHEPTETPEPDAGDAPIPEQQGTGDGGIFDAFR